MKRFFILVTMVVLILASCSTKENTKKSKSILDQYKVINTMSEVKDGNFIYRLVSEKKEYVEGESVKIYAELEYVGKEKNIKIYHASSPFSFNMVEKSRNYKIDYIMTTPLVSTTLEKGKPIRKEYKGSGGYSQDDPIDYINFIKKITTGKTKFPYGYYIIDGNANFDIETNSNGKTVKKDYNIKGQIDFKVNKKK